MRLLFVLLAVVVAVLAFLMDQSWLYLVAAGLLLAALGLVASRLWKVRQRQQARARKSAGSEEDELRALGITDIRPRAQATQSASSSEAASRQHAAPEHNAAPEQNATAASAEGRPADTQASPLPTARATPVVSEAVPSERASAAASEAATETEEAEAPGLLGPYLHAVQAALGAHTVALLAQEEVALEYQIEGLVSPSEQARRGGTFETRAALLSAGMSRRPATVAPVGEAAPDAAPDAVPREVLAYYLPPAPEVQQVALAPVPLASQAVTYFLLADTLEEGFEHPRAEALMARFADLLGFALRTSAAHDAYDIPGETEPEEEMRALKQELEEEEPIRPRRQIVAEEMGHARAAPSALALAIVYLNRAESIAAKGPERVEEVETALHARLREAAPATRVERFGELTYGLFCRMDAAEAEAWAARLQREMAEADGLLAGGVSIGMAMLNDRHAGPDAFRADATAALEEAYTSGTCTILE